QFTNSNNLAIDNGFDPAQQHWSGNRYWDESAVQRGAYDGWLELSGTSYSIPQWQATVEPTAQAKLVQYPDPTRTLARYNATLGGAATTAAFLDEVRQQSITNWRSAYSAVAVLNYMRTGFGLPNIGGGTTNPPPTATVAAGDLVTSGQSTYSFTVTYSDDT